jgi:hypothetical protein
VLQAPSYLFAPLAAPFDVLHVADAPELVVAAAWVQNIVGAVVLGTSAIVMVRRLRAANPAQRRSFGLVTVVGVGTILFIPAAFHLAPVVGVDVATLFVAQVTAIAIVPVSFVLAVLRGGICAHREPGGARGQSGLR